MRVCVCVCVRACVCVCVCVSGGILVSFQYVQFCVGVGVSGCIQYRHVLGAFQYVYVCLGYIRVRLRVFGVYKCLSTSVWDI